MSTVKADEKKFSQAEVNKIIQKRLARQEQRATEPPRKKTTWIYTGLTPKLVRVADTKPEIRSVRDVIGDSAKYQTVPDNVSGNWLKGAYEALDELKEMMIDLKRKSEIRALDQEEIRALDDLKTTSDAVQASIQKYEEYRSSILQPVEDRSYTQDQKEKVLLDYAFSPEANKEAIKKNLLSEHQKKTDPVYSVLKRVFQRRE